MKERATSAKAGRAKAVAKAAAGAMGQALRDELLSNKTGGRAGKS